MHIYKPVLLLALDEYFRVPTVETLASLFNAVNAMDLSGLPKLNQIERLILLQSDRHDLFSERFPLGQRERSISTSSQISSPDRLESPYLEPITPLLEPSSPTLRDTHNYNTSIVYNGTTIPIAVPLTSLPEVVGDFSVIQLVNTFSKPSTTPTIYPHHPELTTSGSTTHPVMILLNALLSQKRVVLLGHSQPSGQVASQVLAACGMISGGTGILRSFMERAFPYTDLSKIDDLLTVPGFIAGVTNSVFELHPEWWDVLCNVDTGQIIISPNLKSQESASPIVPDPYDAAFMDDLLQSIAERNSESSIRLKFRDWINRFLKLAVSYEVSVHGSSDLSPPTFASFRLPGHGYVWVDEAQKRRDLQSNAARIQAWHGTESYKQAVIDRKAQYGRSSSRVRTFDLAFQLDGLRGLRLSPDASASIFTILNQEILTDMHLTELLSLLPHGNLSIIAAGLMHPFPEARRSVVDLLDRIRDHYVGRFFYASLNLYYRLTHQRLVCELDTEESIP